MSAETSRRDFLVRNAAAAAALTAGAGFAPLPQTSGKKRNIIFILTDDQRFDALGFLGGGYWQTPNMDRLAAKGVHCENTFVTTSLCSPSRASIVSGQYAHTHGVLNNSTLLPKGTPAFPVELQKAGYDTGFVGKWHMGGSSDAARPGFNYWASFRGQGKYINPDFNVNGKQVKREGHVTDVTTDLALDFLNRDRDQPFFLYLSHKAVHGDFPIVKPEDTPFGETEYPKPDSMADTEANYRGRPEWVRKQRESWHGVDGMYNGRVGFDDFVRSNADELLRVDRSLGRITEALQAKRLLDATLILFMGDNGFLLGEHGLIDKRCMYEPSIRVPLIAHCPDLFPEGQTRSEMMLNIDIAPTILEAAGVPVPGTMQGQSFLPLLQGEPLPWRDAFFYEYFWERSYPQTPTVQGVRTERYKLMRYHGVWDRYEMYDLQEDPDEMHNLLGDYIQQHEAGALDHLIRRKAPEPLRKLFDELTGKLSQLAGETGAHLEPRWTD